MNWVIDGLVVIALCVFAVIGFKKGFVDCLFELVLFVIALFVALFFHKNLGAFLHQTLKLPYAFSYVFGFFLILAFIHLGIALIVTKPRKKIRQIVRESPIWSMDRFFGVVPQLVVGLAMISFFLALVVVYSPNGYLAKSIKESKLASALYGPAKSAIKKP